MPITQDLNKNISSIQYNVLNLLRNIGCASEIKISKLILYSTRLSLYLPGVVTFTDGSTIAYRYAADGRKLRTVHTIGSTVTTMDYCGSVVYENGAQKLLLTEEGYVNLAGTKQYCYYLKDHQGNNRVVVNQTGSAVGEANHYYPFGGLFASTSSVQPYKYNGKELDTKKGLNWYDYGARMYDPVLGRFTTQDPMAEKYSSWSLYTYCVDNPIGLVDDDGAQPRLARPVRTGYRNGGRPNPYVFYPRGVKPQSYVETATYSYRGKGLREKIAMGEQTYLRTVNTPGGNEVQMSNSNKWGTLLSGIGDSYDSYNEFRDKLIGLSTTYIYKEDGQVSKSFNVNILDPYLANKQREYDAKAESINKRLGELDFTGKSFTETFMMLNERKSIIQNEIGISPCDIILQEYIVNLKVFQLEEQTRATIPEFRQR